IISLDEVGVALPELLIASSRGPNSCADLAFTTYSPSLRKAGMRSSVDPPGPETHPPLANPRAPDTHDPIPLMAVRTLTVAVRVRAATMLFPVDWALATMFCRSRSYWDWSMCG